MRVRPGEPLIQSTGRTARARPPASRPTSDRSKAVRPPGGQRIAAMSAQPLVVQADGPSASDIVQLSTGQQQQSQPATIGQLGSASRPAPAPLPEGHPSTRHQSGAARDPSREGPRTPEERATGGPQRPGGGPTSTGTQRPDVANPQSDAPNTRPPGGYDPPPDGPRVGLGISIAEERGADVEHLDPDAPRQVEPTPTVPAAAGLPIEWIAGGVLAALAAAAGAVVYWRTA